MANAIVVIVAYLIGSISFAVLVSAALGLSDPRTYGSKNPGATNVLRAGSKLAAILTLAGDALKGYVAVWLAMWTVARFGVAPQTVALAALAVFLGHLYPIFFRFRGGKGVATALGILLAINPWLGLATLVVWLAVAFVLRYSSLAALAAALFAPCYYFYMFGLGPLGYAIVIMSLLLLWRHRGNIRNLLAGRESRLGSKAH